MFKYIMSTKDLIASNKDANTKKVFKEAEDTIRFTKENSEVESGIIHSVGQSIFALEKDSAIYHNPAKFKIDRII